MIKRTSVNLFVAIATGKGLVSEELCVAVMKALESLLLSADHQ